MEEKGIKRLREFYDKQLEKLMVQFEEAETKHVNEKASILSMIARISNEVRNIPRNKTSVYAVLEALTKDWESFKEDEKEEIMNIILGKR